MIEGLKVQILGGKLQTVILAKVLEMRDKATRLRAMLATAGASEPAMNSNVAGMEEKCVGLIAQADELTFIADNLNVSELYQLDTDDLNKIGIVRRHW